jgi:hypothetical protein
VKTTYLFPAFFLILFLLSLFFEVILSCIITPIFFKKYLIEKKQKNWFKFAFGWFVLIPPPFSPLTKTEECLYFFNEEGKKKYPKLKKFHNILFVLLSLTFLLFIKSILLFKTP